MFQLFTLKDHMIRHAELCMSSREDQVVLWSCLGTSLDQQWEHGSNRLLKHRQAPTGKMLYQPRPCVGVVIAIESGLVFFLVLNVYSRTVEGRDVTRPSTYLRCMNQWSIIKLIFLVKGYQNRRASRKMFTCITDPERNLAMTSTKSLVFLV